MINPHNDKFIKALELASTKAHVDITGLAVFVVAVDRTWGDLSGYAFAGPDQLVDRAAKFCVAWHEKELSGKASYNCQNCISDRGVGTIEVATSQLKAHGFPTRHEGTFHAEKLRSVSTTYYPCAD